MPWLHVGNNNQDCKRVFSTQIHLPKSAYSLIHTVMYLSGASQWMYVFFLQVELITTQAMKAGFTGGLVVDYPNSTRAKKWVVINTVCQATHVLNTVNYERTDLFIETSMPILFLPGQPKPIFNKVFLLSFLFVVACDTSFVVSFHLFFRIFLCLFAGVVVDKLPKVGFLFCCYYNNTFLILLCHL